MNPRKRRILEKEILRNCFKHKGHAGSFHEDCLFEERKIEEQERKSRVSASDTLTRDSRDVTKDQGGRVGNATSTKSIVFFDFPAEIRNLIYEYLLPYERWGSGLDSTRLFIPRYAVVSNQFAAEALPIYFARMTWPLRLLYVWNDDWYRTMRWLRDIGDNIKFIQRFNILTSSTGRCGWAEVRLDKPVEEGVNPRWLKIRKNGEKEIMDAFTKMLHEDLLSLRKRGLLTAELMIQSLLTFCEEYHFVKREDVGLAVSAQ